MTKTDRIQIEFDLKFTTLFHCGTGIREGLVDRTVVRDSEGYSIHTRINIQGCLA